VKLQTYLIINAVRLCFGSERKIKESNLSTCW